MTLERPHFLTFATKDRQVLPERAREIALSACLSNHRKRYDLHVVMVMPDHVHMIVTPLLNESRERVVELCEITRSVRSFSAHEINRLLDRHGQVWQEESFDHVLRSGEGFRETVRYVRDNPVRKGLVGRAEDYPWGWAEESS